MNCRVVPDDASPNRDVLADFAVVSNHALVNNALISHLRVVSDDRRVRDATSEVSAYIMSHVFVESFLFIYQLVGVLGGMEDDVVHHKRIAFACNHVWSNDLVSPGISDLRQVESGGQYVGLDLIVSDLARVQLNDEVLL